MKKVIILALMSISTLSFAQSLTREQVKAEYNASVKSGDIIENNTGLKLNELYPNNYPKKEVVSKTREEVKNEYLQAVKSGELQKLNETYYIH